MVALNLSKLMKGLVLFELNTCQKTPQFLLAYVAKSVYFGDEKLMKIKIMKMHMNLKLGG